MNAKSEFVTGVEEGVAMVCPTPEPSPVVHTAISTGRSANVRRSLYAAQRAIRNVAKGDTAEVRKEGKLLYSYDFTSSEDMVAACREALHEAGLLWEMVSWRVEEALPSARCPTLVGTFELTHVESGDVELREYPMPIASRNDSDKALAGAITYLLGQSLRALLLVPKVSEEDAKNDPDRREHPGWQSGDAPRATERRVSRAKEQIPSAPTQAKPTANTDDFAPTGETTDHLKSECRRLSTELRKYMRGISPGVFRSHAGVTQNGQLSAAELRTYKGWLERTLAEEKHKVGESKDDDLPDWAGPTPPGTLFDGLDQRSDDERIKPIEDPNEAAPSERWSYPKGKARHG